MSWSNIHVRDYGWTGKLMITQDKQPVDISSYTTLKFILKPPKGASIEKTAVFDTNGQDGVMKYLFVQGDVTQSGTWEVQARISKDGVELTSKSIGFNVKSRL